MSTVTPTPAQQALMARANAARRLIRQGHDPWLLLAYVVWPTRRMLR